MSRLHIIELEAQIKRRDARIAELEAAQPVRPVVGMRDAKYSDSTPKLSVGNSSFEDWYQAHEKACSGDKQLARDAYAAGMGDPLVTYAQPVQPATNDAIARAFNLNGTAWAVSRWIGEVQHRPLVNKNRRTLDYTWRQVISYFGGDAFKLLGPDHDTLLQVDGPAWMPPEGVQVFLTSDGVLSLKDTK